MNTNPTTVRGWLETLPEPLMAMAIEAYTLHPDPIYQDAQWEELGQSSLKNAIEAFIWSDTRQGFHFWDGVHSYLMGLPPSDSNIIGHNAAKAAFGAVSSIGWSDNDYGGRKMKLVLGKVTENSAEMSLQASADGKNFVDVKLQNPSYVAISPERLAELEAIEAKYNERAELIGENVNVDALWEKMQQNADKAAKWDTFGPKMRYIINTFEDLEGLKP